MNKGFCLENDTSDRFAGPAAQKRLSLLKYLCESCDFGFITEPGNDLRSAVKKSSVVSVLGGGSWWGDTRKDTQKNDKDACRPLLYFKSAKPMKGVALATMAGSKKKDRERYAPAVCLSFPPYRMALVSLHATAGSKGSNGRRSTREFVAELDDRLAEKEFDFYVMGGDFNAHMKEERFAMPNEPTHQSGNMLDGFCFGIREGVPIQVRIGGVEPLYKGNPGFRLIEADDNTQNNDHRGFSVLMAGASESKHNKSTRNPAQPYWLRLSDHAPVIATLNIQNVSASTNKTEASMSDQSGSEVEDESDNEEMAF